MNETEVVHSEFVHFCFQQAAELNCNEVLV